MVLLLFNIPADRFGIHIVVGHCLVPLAVVHIGKTVRSLVNFAGLAIVNALVAEGGIALLLAHNGLTDILLNRNECGGFHMTGTGAHNGVNGGTAPRTSSTRKYVCPCCGNSVRATKAINIACLDCNRQMLEV